MSEIFTPEFIPFYIDEVNAWDLTPTEGLVYWFCRFYKKNNKKFYFNSKQLWYILGCSSWTIDNSFSNLVKKWIISSERKSKVWGWTLRFVNNVQTLDSRCAPNRRNSDLTKWWDTDLTKWWDTYKENNIIKENKNNINIINDSDSKESTSLQESNEIEIDLDETITRNANEYINNTAETWQKHKRSFGDTWVNDVIKIVQDKCKELWIVYQKWKNERARAKNFTQKTKTEQIQDAGFNCFSDYVDFVFDKQNKFKIWKTINSVENLYYKWNDVINQYNLNFKNLDNLKFEIHERARVIAENPEKYWSHLYHNVCKYSTRLWRWLLEWWILLDVENALEEIRKDYVITNFDLIVSMEEHYNYYINKSYKEWNYISSLRKRIFNNLKRSAWN